MAEIMPKNRNVIRRGVALAGVVGGIALPGVLADAASKQETTRMASATTASGHHHRHHRRRHAPNFTGYEVDGLTSTFGWPSDGSDVGTADEGTSARACIALKNHSTLDHLFQVTVLYHHVKHQAKLVQCDTGPAGERQIDVSGHGAEKLGFNPYDYPTDSWGIARELQGPKVSNTYSP